MNIEDFKFEDEWETAKLAKVGSDYVYIDVYTTGIALRKKDLIGLSLLVGVTAEDLERFNNE